MGFLMTHSLCSLLSGSRSFKGLVFGDAFFFRIEPLLQKCCSKFGKTLLSQKVYIS